MSILNVNQLQPVGGGNTITVSAPDVSASAATITVATVQVGSATTIHTTGIDLGDGNIQSHNINSTGIITATEVNVTGTLTYEDVTNVDAVGIITAQAGIHVTGGSIGIGTDNPFAKLHVNITSPTTVPAAGSNSHPVVIGDVGFGAAIGALHNGKSYIQGTRWDGTATNYSLLLNPNGGSIGIGTDNPREKLDISAGRIILDQDYQFTWANGTTNRARIYGDSGNNFIVENGSSNTERFRITSGGSVGIGTDNPALQLHVEDSGSQIIRFARTSVGAGSLDIDGNGNAVFNSHTNNASVVFHTQTTERIRITSNVGPWAEGNKGSTPGTLHLKPGSTDHMGGAITFGASDSGSGDSAMAGIYTRSDSTYGTKMYLATTDSYDTGPKNFLEADQHGRIGTPRQPFIYGRPTNTGGSGIFNAMGNTTSRGGLTFSSDRITVAREGVYIITFNTICDSSTGRKDARIRVNGGTIVNTLSEANGNGFHYRGASICYYLNANDYIQVDNDDWYDQNSSTTDWKTLSIALLG